MWVAFKLSVGAAAAGWKFQPSALDLTILSHIIGIHVINRDICTQQAHRWMLATGGVVMEESCVLQHIPIEHNSAKVTEPHGYNFFL